MKIRITTGRGWYMSYVGNVFDVDKEKEYGYLVTSIGGWKGTIYKEDAEVVEEKRCKTCEFDKYNMVDECRCFIHTGVCENYEKWQPIKIIEKKEYISGKYPVTKREALINLIKLNGKNEFTYYINVDKINSLTETKDGVSISTADNDGDYLVVDSIGEVLAKLGWVVSDE